MKSLDSSSPIVAVLCDFGISRVSSDTNTLEMIGTPGFIAPEILMQEQYDISADVSSFVHMYSDCNGCSVLELSCGSFGTRK